MTLPRKRLLVVLLAGLVMVVAAVPAAVLAAMAVIDPNRFRGPIAAAVEKEIGRAVVIETLAWVPSLWPRLSAAGIRVANPPWAAAPDLFRLARIEVALDLPALLIGRLQVGRLVIDGAELALEIDSAGRESWPTAQPGTGAPAPEPAADRPVPAPPPVVFTSVQVRGARLAFKDARSGEQVRLEVDHLVALMDGADAPIRVFGALGFNGEAITLAGVLGSLPMLRANRDYPVELAAGAANGRLGITGRIAQPLDQRGIDLTVRADGPVLADLGRLIQAATGKPAPLPAIGAYAVTARVVGDVRNLSAPHLALRLGADQGARVDVSGTAERLFPPRGVDLVLSAALPDGTVLAPLSRAPIPAFAPVAVQARLRADAARAAVDDLDLTVGRSRFLGTLAVAFDGKPIRIKAQLTSPFLDVLDLIPRETDTGPTPAAEMTTDGASPGDGAGTGDGSGSGAVRRLFSDRPLPFNALRQASADVDFKADRIVARELQVGKVELRGFLRRGVIHVTKASGRLANGEALASFTVDARRGDRASLHTGLTIEGIEIGSLLRDTGADDTVTGAPIAVRLSLTGAGGSVRELMAGLAGDLLVRVGPGRFENAALDLLGADLLSEIVGFLNPFGTAAEGTVLNCAVAAAVLRQGRALIDRTVAIETGKTQIVVGGEVNLGTEDVDLAVRTESRGGFTVNAGMLTSLMRLSGTMSKPSVTVDSMGMARTAASLAAAWATGGISLLAEAVVGAVTRDASPCQSAFQRAKLAAAR